MCEALSRLETQVHPLTAHVSGFCVRFVQAVLMGVSRRSRGKQPMLAGGFDLAVSHIGDACQKGVVDDVTRRAPRARVRPVVHTEGGGTLRDH